MNNRDIIVIGGSAGATKPLREILGQLPDDLPAAVFVVLHIPAQGLGLLSTVAGSAAQLPVHPAADGMAIERGNIYIAVPDRHLLLADSLAQEQEGKVDEALRVALRIIEERAELVARMAAEGREGGRPAVAAMYDARAREYRDYADQIRKAVLRSFTERGEAGKS